MATEFDHITDYCAALTANNNRPWFHEHHAEYEVARKDFAELLERLRFEVCAGAPALEADIMYTKVKDWTYRIPRDARIHTDQPPYNPAFRAFISADRKSWLPIGYFIHLSHEGCFYGTGIWCRDTASTNKIRDYISAHAEEMGQLIKESGIVLQGEQLKTMPRGYSADCPGAEWIKFKNWMFFEYLPKRSMRTFSGCGKAVREMTARFEPMRQFLMRAAAEEPEHKEVLSQYYSVREPDMW